MEDSDEPTLRRILIEPKNALVKQYQRLFEMENVELTLAEDALGAISRKAIERKTGARGLRSIMEILLLDTMFDLPGLEGVERVVISQQVVEGNARPLYIYVDRAGAAGASDGLGSDGRPRFVPDATHSASRPSHDPQLSEHNIAVMTMPE